jgi:hypothetical protein
LRVAQIALRLHDLEVGGEADLVAALLGLEPPLRQLHRSIGRLQPPRFDSTCTAAFMTSLAICSSS